MIVTFCQNSSQLDLSGPRSPFGAQQQTQEITSSPLFIVGMVGKRYESYVARTDLVTCKFQVLLAAVLSISIFALIFLRYKRR